MKQKKPYGEGMEYEAILRTLADQIGRFVMAFAELESTLADGTGELLVLSPEKARVITAQMSFASLTEAFCALLTMKDAVGDQPASGVKAWKKRLQNAELRRNRLVHSDWAGYDLEPPSDAKPPSGGLLAIKSVARAKDGHYFKGWLMSVDEIEQDIRELGELSEWASRQCWPLPEGEPSGST